MRLGKVHALYTVRDNDRGDTVSVYLGCLCKAKSSSYRLGNSIDEQGSFENEMKTLIQPMMEVMAIAEVAKFSVDMVPLVNIFMF